ncbi:hypothetical protein VTN02DRAFT_2621 [Thermoascus thermophilus]
MAIPRLPEGAEAAFTSPGRYHRRHREVEKLASLSAKVQAYEEVIRKLSLSFGVSDEQLMNSAMTAEATHGLVLQSDLYAAASRGRKFSGSSGSERPSSRSSSVGSFDEVDRVEEDFNRDETARATGFIGKSSEITWLQKLGKELNHESDSQPEACSDGVQNGQSSPSLASSSDPSVASSSYFLDDLNIAVRTQVDAYEVPSRETAGKLFNAYLTSVHPTFPIIGISTFVSQYQLFFSQPSVKPGNKWLAILNLIFAIAARYSHVVQAEWRDQEDDHQAYFSRARILSMEDQLFEHPDLQQLQVEGLASFYLLSIGQINRSWKLCGSAVRGAEALGLHLRNVGIYTSDTSKEIRYRVWWSLYTIEHLLSVMTGRPSCIVDSTCTTPLPVPFDESDFQKEEVAQLISNPSRKSSTVQDRAADSNTPAPDQMEATNTEAPTSKVSEIGSAEWLKSLPPSMSLYFLQFSTLTSIAKRVNIKLYSAEAVQSPWPSIEFTIQSLMLETDSWLSNLPEPYDFTSLQTSQSILSQRMSLAFLFYSIKTAITRPCLCRLDPGHSQGNKAYDFCSKTAAECVESACHMLKLLPDTPDAVLLHKISPWWCILHYLMQATTVLLLELAFRAQHVPEKAETVSKATKKAIEWLYDMSKSSTASYRAWKLCDDFLHRLAPHVGIDVSDLPCNNSSSGGSNNEPSIASNNNNNDADPATVNLTAAATPLDTLNCPLMDQTTTAPVPPFAYGLEQPEILEFLKPEKPLSIRSGYDEYLPYDPATGQITGSFFPTSANIDLELGYVWGDPIC